MLKKTFLGVLFAVLILALLIAGINFNITKAADYGSSGTTVGGIIGENTTWTLENSPYIIIDTMQIPENVTLTIEPGVAVTRPTSGDMFLLHGTVYAHGTANNKIVFDGGGNSNFFNVRNSDKNTFLDLEYCIIKNGGGFWDLSGGVGCGPFSLKHSELIDVGGAYVWYPKGDVHIEYNKFINTGGITTGIGDEDVEVFIKYNLFKQITSPIQNNRDYFEEAGTIVKYNSFSDVDGYILALGCTGLAVNMSATENYWGTLDTYSIDLKIYDRNDDINCPVYIDYLPILAEPHPDTPTLPLIVNFTYSPSTVYAKGRVNFNASASFGLYSDIANYTWKFGDGNTTTSNAPTIVHTYELPSNYNVTLTATDEFGFRNSTTTTLTVYEDGVHPTTSDDYDGLWHNSGFTITLTATDNESGVAETYYRINGGTVRAISTDGQPCITTEDANNRVEYWSVDNADNEELPHKILTGIKLDKTPPAIGIPSRIPEGDVQPNQIVKVFVNVTDSTSGVESVRLAYFINNSTIGLEFFMAFNSTTGLYFTSFGIPGQQANTLVRYAIRTYDNAGNCKVEDNEGQYYVYTVIPEFPQPIILLLFAFTTLIATILLKKKARPKSPPPFSLK